MMEHRKLTFANGLHTNRWRSYRSLEMTVNIWNQSRSKENVLDGKTFWDRFVDFRQADVDFTNDGVNRHAEIISNIFYTIKHLRGKNIRFAMMVLHVTLPLREKAKKIAATPFLPKGVDTRGLRTLTDKGGCTCPIQDTSIATTKFELWYSCLGLGGLLPRLPLC